MPYLQDSSLILGEAERGRTRSQTRKISESGEPEEKKPAVKRAGTMEQTIKVNHSVSSLENMIVYRVVMYWSTFSSTFC